MAAYFVVLQAYAAMMLVREARAGPGLRRRRLLVAASGPFFLGLGIVLSILAQAIRPLAAVDDWVYPSALLAVIGFYLGFLPPAWLREAWQMREVRKLLAALAQMETRERLDGNAVLLCQSAMGAVGGSDARLVIRDDGGWRVVTPRGEAAQGTLSDVSLERIEALLSAETPRDLEPTSHLGPEISSWIQAVQARRVLAVPVLSPGRRWGMLLVALRDVPLFLEDDLELVRLLCDQIAMRLDADAYLHVQHRLLERIEKANEELEQFAVVVSHDLQEPLRMVASYVSLLERRYGEALDQDARDFLAYAAEGAGRMQDLIRDLLAYARARTEALEFRMVDLDEILARVQADLRSAIEESGAVLTHDPLPTLEAFEVQMVQLFQNLVGNALKFAGSEPPRIHVSALDRDAHWEILVRDHGVGIDPRYAKQIFGVFKRVPGRDVPGTGIGLAICRRIVERHGGSIWADPAEGGGTEIRFTLAKNPFEQAWLGHGAKSETRPREVEVHLPPAH
jgi:signal transduction histidine kinase